MNSLSFFPQISPVIAPQRGIEPPTSVDLSPVFIEANTIAISKSELSTKCTIPVFAEDNEATISHSDFISVVEQTVGRYHYEYNTRIRVSHPVKGRIHEARYKKASELQPHEETLYYERMMFVIDVPTVRKDFGDNSLSLTIGGVRSYHLDNLHSKKSAEKFKLFIGFKNKVCSNLCVWTGGLVEDIKVTSVYELQDRLKQMIDSFNPNHELDRMRSWQNRFIT